MRQIHPSIKALVEEVAPSKMAIGRVLIHPESGKRVKIISGQFWGTHGVSNFWEWREYLPSGRLKKKVVSGYGW